MDSILLLSPSCSDKPAGRGKGESSLGKNVSSGKTGRGKGEKGSKGSGRPSDSGARSKERKSRGRSGSVRDGPSSSQVCFKCGSTDHRARDCPKMDDGSSNPKKRNIGAYDSGAWTCNIPDHSRVEKCSNHLDDSMCLDFQCGAAVSPVQDEDECEAHAAFPVEFEGFGALDCDATTSFGSVEGAEASFSKINENDTRIPDVDPYRGKCHSIWEMVHRQKPRQLLMILESLRTCSVINQNRLHWF